MEVITEGKVKTVYQGDDDMDGGMMIPTYQGN
jgi:hypothetical protein